MSNIVLSQVSKIASAFNMQDVDPAELANTLVNTVFKKATNDEFLSLLIVANQYKLNPFTKEIYAFPAKGGGITPVVGIDGWARIINDNPVCDGIQFEQDDESCTCKIFRKDRNHPTVVTEYLSECQGNSEPWKKYPKRMLRHKALIQCARVAFGFSGIYDEDEARRIDDCHIPTVQTVSSDLPQGYEAYEQQHLDNMRALAMEGTEALQTGYAELPQGDCKKYFWTKHSVSLKEAAQNADQPQGQVYEHSPA
ncbi:phage recombination protein Bet [Acinetobacter baumannii]|uniref:phage recombination protein Bet n=1 Tax=Acinetobacter baumannii TaxID=470 RepID=UPI00040342D8|nr:phage recombination protein Bet [Acinetobacter baumannii]RSQ55591.1 phage recombination protein Bet [Acinetobacter baumannii]